MKHVTTMTVRLSGALSEFVASNVGEDRAHTRTSANMSAT